MDLGEPTHTLVPCWTPKPWLGETTRTLIIWRQGLRHLTRNVYMGWFAQIPKPLHPSNDWGEPAISYR